MVKRLKWLWITIFWMVLIVGLLEVSLRLFPTLLPPRLQQVAYTVINGTPYAQAWDTAWVRNNDHYYIVKPGLDNALQYGSPSVAFHVSTIELWDGGGIGFRNRPVDYFVDAVVVGDSFTFCFTEREDCWVTHLEQNTGMGIVNLGQPTTGTRSHFLILENFGQPYTPPVVIWQFFGNDFNDDYGLLRARDEIEPLEDEQPSVDASSDELSGITAWLRTNLVLFALVDVLLSQNTVGEDVQFQERYQVLLPNGQHLGFGQPYEPNAMDMQRPANQAGYDASRQSFQQARDLVDSWGGELVVVLMPTREQVYAEWTSEALRDDLDKIDSARLAMLELCEELELLCYDPLTEMQALAETANLLYYDDDMHLNPEGNRVFANLVGQWLSENELIP